MLLEGFFGISGFFTALGWRRGQFTFFRRANPSTAAVFPRKESKLSRHALLPCHARSRVWPLRGKKSGSGAHGLAYRNLNTWRSFRAPPVSVATVDRSRAPLHVLSMDNDARMIRLPSRALALRLGMPARRTPSEVVGTESTPGGHRRPTDPRSGTGSRKGDGRIMREGQHV